MKPWRAACISWLPLVLLWGCLEDFFYYYLFPHVREKFNKLQNHKFNLGGGRKNSNFFVLHGDCVICINIACLFGR